MITQMQRSVLRALFELASEDQRATLGTVAEVVDLDSLKTTAILHELERAGLADAGRLRLTMMGLALAVSARPLERRHAEAA